MSPGQIVLSASCPARPRPAAPPCAPTRLARGMSGFWARQFFEQCLAKCCRCSFRNAWVPGHALHARGLQGQKGDGPLVSSQERRAARRPTYQPRANCLSNASFFPPPLYIGFRLFVLLGGRSKHLSTMPWGVRGTVVSSAKCSVGIPSCPAPPRRAPPRPDPPVVCPGFGFEKML